MARSIATVTGTALVPGVSRNGRLYTRENIRKAVERAKARIADGRRPISMRTHHAADDDSSRIVGRVTHMWQDPDTGAARYRAQIADTSHGRDIAALVDDSDGSPQFLRGVSIRGAWASQPRTETHDGHPAQTADDLEIAGLDYTAEPGVDDADVSTSQDTAVDGDDQMETAAAYPITESAPEALVSIPATIAVEAVDEKGAPALKSGQPAAAPTKAPPGTYADPGYQDDKAKRYPLDTKAHAKAAWAYINQADNAKQYTAAQLKRIKGRIIKALIKYGVKLASAGTESAYLIDPCTALTETTTLAECVGCWTDQGAPSGYFISMTNGPTTLTITSTLIDPADLDLVGRAAMDGACKALLALDPDMDGDIDVPGAPDEDTDAGDGMPDAAAPGMACTCGCGCAIPHPDTTNLCPCGCGCDLCRSEQDTDADETHPDGGPGQITETGGAEPVPEPITAPDPAADPNTETEEPDMSEPTTPAVEPTPEAATNPAGATAPASLTLTSDQFEQLLARINPPAAAVAPQPDLAGAETAQDTAQVTETEEQRIARLVREGVAAERVRLLQEMTQAGQMLPERKGLIPQAPTPEPAAPVAEGLNSFGMPAAAPNKPLHQYSTDEWRRAIGGPLLEHYTVGRRG
jgi:hypothetical protein